MIQNSILNSVMETRDHLKNGASPKSLMSRENFKTYYAWLSHTLSGYCENGNMTKILLSIIVLFFFNLSVYSQTIDIQYVRQNSKEVLSKFCDKYYNDCFSGRRYVSKSLTVTEVKVDANDSNTVRVDWYHEYLNYLDISDRQPYYAIVTVNTRTNRMKIVFNKKSKNWFGEDYWESCTKEGERNRLLAD